MSKNEFKDICYNFKTLPKIKDLMLWINAMLPPWAKALYAKTASCSNTLISLDYKGQLQYF